MPILAKLAADLHALEMPRMINSPPANGSIHTLQRRRRSRRRPFDQGRGSGQSLADWVRRIGIADPEAPTIDGTRVRCGPRRAVCRGQSSRVVNALVRL